MGGRTRSLFGFLLVLVVGAQLSFALPAQAATGGPGITCTFFGFVLRPFGFCDFDSAPVSSEVTVNNRIFDIKSVVTRGLVAGESTTTNQSSITSTNSWGLTSSEAQRIAEDVYAQNENSLKTHSALLVALSMFIENKALSELHESLSDSISQTRDDINQRRSSGGGSVDLSVGGTLTSPIINDPTIAGNINLSDLPTNALIFTDSTGNLSALSSLSVDDSGNLLIGTTSVQERLTVDGPIYLGDSTPATTANRLYSIGSSLYWNGSLVSASSSSNWSAASGNVYRPTGSVGIGTSSPFAELSVVGDIALTGGLYDSNASLGTNGMVLQTTGSSIGWVSTSSLGLAADLSGSSIEDFGDVSAMTKNFGDLLYWNGSSWADIATSALAISTTNLSEGSNLFFTNTRVNSLINSSSTILSNNTENGLESFLSGVSNVFTNNDIIGDVNISDSITASNYLALSDWYATTTDGLSEGGTNLYFTNARSDARFNTNFNATTTTALAEGSNLYFTNARVASYINSSSTVLSNNTESGLESFLTGVTNVFTNNDGALSDDDLSNNSTTDLAEGSNLYYTLARFAAALSGTTTDALAEGGTNQYFTNARVASYILGSTTISRLGQTIDESELNTSGTVADGFILQASSTASGGFVWVATSTLGISSGGGGATAFTDLTDTPGSYSTGDIFYASSGSTIVRLAAGGDGTVLKISGGVPTWGADLSSGGGAGVWASSTDNLLIYPSDTADVVVIGGSATTTTGFDLEVIGDALVAGIQASVATVTNAYITSALDVNGHAAFGNAGTVNSDRILQVDENISTNNNFFSFYNNPKVTATLSGSRTGYGSYNLFEADAITEGANDYTAVGVYAEVQVDGSSSVGSSRAGQFVVDYNSSTGFGDNAYTLSSTLEVAGGATVSNGYGYFSDLDNQGTITNYYGIFLQDVSEGAMSNSYAFWTNQGDMVLDGDGNGLAGGNDGGSDLFFGEGQDAAIWYDGTNLNINPRVAGSGSVIVPTGNVGVGTSTPSQKLTVNGNAYITGALYDNASSSGTNGMVLQTTGSGFNWVATSSLGLPAGTVTSVDMSVPTGFSISGNPITSAGTLAVTYAAGYEGLLTASSSNWNTFYNTPSSRIAAGTGLSWGGNTITAEVQSSDLLNYLALSDWYATTTDGLSEGGTNLYFTNARSDARFNTNFNATTTTALAEGSNLYFTNARASSTAIAVLSATTSLPNLTSLAALSSIGTITSGVWQGNPIAAVYGGTGTSTYLTGDLLYAASSTALTRLGIGGEGSVLKVSGGIPFWGTDLSGDTAIWATSTNGLYIYPADTNNIVVIGASATSTNGYLLEVNGNTLVNGIFATAATTTNLTINNERFTDLTGDGLQNSSNALAVNCADLEGTGIQCSSNNFALDFSEFDTDSITEGSTNFWGKWGETFGKLYYAPGGSFNVGVGDTDSDYTFEVASTNGNGYFAISATANGDGDILEVDSSGNVGINDNTPSFKLDVNGTLRATGLATFDSGISVNSESFTDLTGTALINSGGVLSVSTSSLAAYFASTTAFDTSAELAAILTDETGTGLAVFSASPAFSGTATFSALTATSTLTMSGSAANIALGANNYLSGDGDDEGWSMDTAGRARLYTTNAGESFLWLRNTATNGGSSMSLTFEAGSSGIDTAKIQSLLRGSRDDVDMLFHVNIGNTLTEVMRVSNNNALLIGTTTPNARLSVQSTGTNDIFNLFETSGTEVFTVLESGNIGVGTTSPSHLFSVAGNTYITGALYGNNGDAGTNGMVLQSTGTGFNWVATSTLGLGGAGGGTVTSVDMSVPTGFSVSGSPVTTSGTLALSYAAGYEGLLTASSTNWNSFYDTPSTRITDGTGLTWSGNTLNLDNDFGATIDESELNITGSPTDGYLLQASSTSAGGFAWVATSTLGLGNISLFTDGGATTYLTSSDNLGIGTSTASSKLTVWGGLEVGTSSVPALAVDTNNGRVAIGTSTTDTSARLSVYDGSVSVLEATPELVASTSVGSATDGTSLQGDYLYIPDWTNNGFRIYNIANPTAPVQVGNISNVAMTGVVNVAAHGNYAYVSSYTRNSISVVDITDPTNPTFIFELRDTTVLNGVSSVSFNDGYIYASAGLYDAIVIVDIHNPHNPKIVSSVRDVTTLDALGAKIIKGNYMFVLAYGYDAIHTYDISNPTNPVLVGSLIDSTNLNGVARAILRGNTLYVASQLNNSVSAVDVSDPLVLSLKDTLVDATNIGSTQWFKLAGDYLYINNYAGNKLTTVSVASTTNLTVAGVTNVTGPLGMEIQGDYLFVATDGPSLKTYKLASVSAPTSRLGYLFSDIANIQSLNVNAATVYSNFDVFGNSYMSGTLSILGSASSTVSNSPQLSVGGLSSRDSYLSFLSDTNKWSVGLDQTDNAFKIASSSALGTNDYFIISASGNVGIGSTSPGTRLTVGGNTYIGGNLTATGTLNVSGLSSLSNASSTALTISGRLYDNTNSAGTNGMVLQTTGTGFNWVATSTLGFASLSTLANYLPLTGGSLSGNLSFSGTTANIALGSNWLSGDGGDEGITIDSTGRAFINNTTSYSSDDLLTLTNQGGYTSMSINSHGSVSYEASTLNFRRGRGTVSSPAAVQDDDLIMQLHMSARGSSSWTNVGDFTLSVDGVPSGNNVPSRFSFFTTNSSGVQSEVMRLDSQGRVGIGTTSPASNLDVWGSFRAGTSSTPTLFANTTNQRVGILNSNPALALHVGSSSVTDSTNLLRLEDANSTCNFNADTGSPSCGSDITLKKDINIIENELERIVALEPSTWRWKTDSSGAPLKSGFIAQEVEKQFPDLVTESLWVDGTTRKFLNVGGLMPYVVGAVKEQQETLEELLVTGTSTQGTSSPFYKLFDGEEDTVWEKLVKLAQGFGDGILKLAGIETEILYARDITAETVTTDKLCIGTTCVTESELQALLGGSSTSNSNHNSGGGNSGNQNPSTPPDNSSTTDTGTGTTTDSTNTGSTTPTGTGSDDDSGDTEQDEEPDVISSDPNDTGTEDSSITPTSDNEAEPPTSGGSASSTP